MKKTLAILSATTILAMGGVAFAADEAVKSKNEVQYKDDGGYESNKSSQRKTADGTTHTSESKVDVNVDSKGHVSKTVKSESSTDPKGLLNKKEETVKSEMEEKDRGGYKQTTTREHKDAEGANVTDKQTVDVKVDKDGNVIETTKSEKVVDPKGLMNKEKTVSKSKMVNGRVVEQKAN